jgi:hypothetical protein
VYPEITAYAVSVGCVWFRRTGDARYLERARRCAEFMIRLAQPGVPGPEEERVYLFDTGILVSGLVDLFAVTSENRFREEAIKRLDWMLGHFDGHSFAATHPESRSPSGLWQHRRSVHLGKLALPLLKVWRVTGNQAYRDGADALLDWALALQEPDGRFRIGQGERATMTHPHCYVSEALLYAAWALKNSTFHAAVMRAAAWLARVQNLDGSFYKWYPHKPHGSGIHRLLSRVARTKVSDATAQSLRLWRLLGVHELEAERAARYLLAREAADAGLPNHVRTLGGIQWRQGRVYAWPTFFWHHALTIQHGEGARAEEMF